MKRKKILKILICLSLLCVALSACAKKEEAVKPVKYVKDSLCEISFTYPKNYKEDFRDENQVSYLLNGNEGLIFILRWDEGIDTDMEKRGEEKKVNDIDGYYWIDKDDKSHNFGFTVKNKEGQPVDYFVSADDEEVFWNIVKSLKVN